MLNKSSSKNLISYKPNYNKVSSINQYPNTNLSLVKRYHTAIHKEKEKKNVDWFPMGMGNDRTFLNNNRDVNLSNSRKIHFESSINKAMDVIGMNSKGFHFLRGQKVFLY